ncbi:MAG: hypothetical protein WA718_10730 [Terriglobales bacterium]
MIYKMGSDRFFRSAPAFAFLLVMIFVSGIRIASAQASTQAGPYERAYPQSKSAVEKTLKELQSSMRGKLPVLEGFALPGDHPLDRYQRAYYEASVQVSSNAAGGSVVRVTTKVTAWYPDPTPSRSGYQLLTSNGRLESDLLDQLTDLLASTGGATNLTASSGGKKAATDRGSPDSAISAPMPQLPETGRTFPSSVQQGPSSRPVEGTKNSQSKSATPAANQTTASLQAEAESLEEVLKNQAHPKNLVAIKKTGTPVVSSPSLNGQTLFLASAHDEFEMLDFNADWVHVRISGLSRGWIWRTSLEMPQGISDVPLQGAKAAPVAADLFQVSREETATFPGDWDALRGKNVRIISVQKIQEDEKNSGAQAKLEYVKSLLDKNYAELAAKSQELAGVVMIFDSVDGGMIAITLPTVQQWKAGKLNDAALWHRCYFDPPETFSVTSAAAGR